jgi:hypothetical protein
MSGYASSVRLNAENPDLGSEQIFVESLPKGDRLSHKMSAVGPSRRPSAVVCRVFTSILGPVGGQSK